MLDNNRSKAPTKDENEPEGGIILSTKLRKIILHGALDSSSIPEMAVALIELESSRKRDPVEILISSPGGSMIAANTLYSMLGRSPLSFNTTVIGEACSAAVLLLQAGKKRRMGSVSYLMIHGGSTGVSGKLGKCQQELDFFQELDWMVDRTIADRIGMPFHAYRELQGEGERYIFSTEAKELNFIDEIF
jgi:ATP-dependent Clp protease protease subunit